MAPQTITDLLDTEKVNLKVKENEKGDVYVAELTDKMVCSNEEMMETLGGALQSRHVAATKMNATSSRSHTIFRVTVESCSSEEDSDGAVRTAQLNLVDLAGSERVANTGAAGERLKEAGNINKSLLTLGSVIAKLSEGGGTGHVNYRDSKLTRILQNSLGGNARTGMICACTTFQRSCSSSAGELCRCNVVDTTEGVHPYQMTRRCHHTCGPARRRVLELAQVRQPGPYRASVSSVSIRFCHIICLTIILQPAERHRRKISKTTP